ADDRTVYVWNGSPFSCTIYHYELTAAHWCTAFWRQGQPRPPCENYRVFRKIGVTAGGLKSGAEIGVFTSGRLDLSAQDDPLKKTVLKGDVAKCPRVVLGQRAQPLEISKAELSVLLGQPVANQNEVDLPGADLARFLVGNSVIERASSDPLADS